MGVSDGFQGGGSGCELDCSVGTIVWVRRRNGSWWPGRILGPEELSASHLMSPRSGTPVKLLGREDASVDWYNLEKSKRVKTFRCGEFDDCIDKAEKSQGAAIKKREKYARREDAILHALELERLQLEKKLGIANGSSSKLPPQLKKELVAPTERVGYDHGKLVNLKAQSLSKGLGSSLEEESTENHLYAQKEKFVKLPIGVKDNSEALPRMRGLQDFGLRTSSTKRKLSASEGSCKAFSDDIHVPGLPSGSRSMDGANHVNSSRNSLAVKRKTQGTENSLVKRRDRRRPLVQILQSSAKMPVSHALQSDGDVSLSVQGEKEQMGVVCRAKRSRCIYQPAESNELLNHTDLSSDEMQRLPSQFGMDNGRRTPGSSTEENTSSGVMDEAESDSSERDYLNPEMDEEMAVLQDLTHTMTGTEPRISKRYMANFHVQGQTESMSSEDLDESAVNGYMPHLHPHDQIAAGATDVGVSKWQLKGKRNTRNLMKRPMEMGPKGLNGSIYAAYLEGKRNSLKKRSLGQTLYHGHDALNYDYDEDELIEKKPTQTQLSGFGNRRYPSMLKDFGASNTDTVESEDDTVWEAEGPSQTPFRGYWDESAELDPVYAGQRLGNGKKSMLVDVDLQVRSSYQGERVPLVSLMSRLNGKAIVGHPVQIEALEDGSTAAFFSSLDDSSGEPVGNDGSTSLKPVWRTARRTAMHRIPRPHPSTALNEEGGGGPSQYSDLEVKPLYKKPHSENPYQKARKSFRYPEKRSSKKPIKKVSLSNQKTRTLSSIAIDHKVSGKACNPKHENKSGSLDGLIKPENGPLACIPVKIVFSRLMEAVGKPPSRLPNHSTVNGDTEKNHKPQMWNSYMGQ